MAEVAVPVEQADADEGHAEVARRFEVIAGEHAEAAGILRQRLADPELGGEVADELQGGSALQLEPTVVREIAAELVRGVGEEPHEACVFGECLQAPWVDGGDDGDRVAPRRLPEVGIDPAEEVSGLLVPRPSEVQRERLEGSERFWQPRTDGEAAERFHDLTLSPFGLDFFFGRAPASA